MLGSFKNCNRANNGTSIIKLETGARARPKEKERNRERDTERDRERHTQRERQTDSQRQRETGTQTDRLTDRQRQRDGWVGRWIDNYVDINYVRTRRTYVRTRRTRNLYLQSSS